MIVPAQRETEAAIPSTRAGGPTWPVALLFPNQGQWTEEDYLALDSRRLVELSDGCLEVLPVPSPYHQLIALLLVRLLEDFVYPRQLGLVFVAPLCVKLWPEKIRQPDVIFLRSGRLATRQGPAAGADLVVEIVSEGAENRGRDLVTKRKEYARAAIPEYWIVDPASRQITVLALHGKKYRVHGVFAPGEHAASLELPGFTVDVAAVFAVEEKLPAALRTPATAPTKSKRGPKA